MGFLLLGIGSSLGSGLRGVSLLAARRRRKAGGGQGTIRQIFPRSQAARPAAAYVEKVYEEGKFAGLGIGT